MGHAMAVDEGFVKSVTKVSKELWLGDYQLLARLQLFISRCFCLSYVLMDFLALVYAFVSLVLS